MVVGFPWPAIGKRLAAQALIYGAPIFFVTKWFPNAFVVLNLATVLVLAQLSVALHEAAHAGMAWLLGFRVRQLTVGQGPLLRSWRWGSFELRLRAIPLVGLTMSVPKSTAFRTLRKWLIVAAGPAVNIALAWLCLDDRSFRVLAFSASFQWQPLADLAYVNAILALTALMPLPTGLGVLSDGAQLLTLPFRTAAPTDPRVLELLIDVADAQEKRDFARVRWLCEEALSLKSALDPAFAMTLHHVEAELGNVEEAIAGMRKQLDSLPSASPYRGLLLNNIAWYQLELERPELLLEAFAMCQESRKKMGAFPWSKGTFGALLVARGYAEAGSTWLRAAFDTNESDQSRAHNAAWLAIAAAQRPNLARAQRWLTIARQLDPECRSIPRAERSLTAQSLPTAAAIS